MKKKNKSIFIVICSFITIGCSLLFISGCVHVLMVDSSPPGAEVYLDGKYRGETPLRANYDIVFDFRDTPRVVEVKMAGYQSKVIRTTDKNMDRYPFNFKLKPQRKLENKFQPTNATLKDYKERNSNAADRMFSSKFKQTWAVIIGISKYQYSGQNGLTNLIFADDDARAFKKTLINQGWDEDHIKCLIDEQATQLNIKEALAGWLTKTSKDDTVVLYWSGHGYPDPSDSRKVYFACHDTDISKPYTGWRMDKVVDAIKEIEPRNVVVIADTCHAGKLMTRSNEKGISVRPYVEQLRQKKKVPPGWIYMVGAETDRKAIEHSKWSNGAFSYCLTQGLEGKADVNGDGEVTMLELKAYMGSTMPEETLNVLGVAKHPIILTNSGDRDIWNLSLKVE